MAKTDTAHVTTQGSSTRDDYTLVLRLAFERAMREQSAISPACLDLPGMSGVKYRMFANNLTRMVDEARYLEVGSWAGSTACSVMDRNVAKVTCIDNWSEFGGPKDAFMAHTTAHRSPSVDFRFIESDFRQVDVPSLGLYNIYLFDGPHEEKDQYDGLHLYDAALENDFYFIVDDWNFSYVRRGTMRAIRDTGFVIDYAIELRTSLTNEHSVGVGQGSDWHNGVFLSKLSRAKLRFD